MEKAWSLALWSVLVCRIAIITDNSKGAGTVPHCKYTDRFGENYGFLDYKEDRYTTVYGYMD